MKRSNRLVAGLFVAALAIVPLIIYMGDSSVEFAGADGQAVAEIERIDPEHKPWFEPVWSPPGSETEGLLFALQAAIGAGVVGYIVGVLRTRQRLDSPAISQDT